MTKYPAADAPQNKITSYLNNVYRNANIETAMEELHQWSLDSDYINREKLEKNIIRDFYDLDYDLYFSFQINYARTAYQPGNKTPLPAGAQCLICRENGSSPGKENLRIFDIELQTDGGISDFFLQLTPFPLFPRHFVLINKSHTPMDMCAQSIDQCLSFIAIAPHYTLCSNSDLEWAGASILSHSHFQLLFKRRLPVMDASALYAFPSQDGTVLEALNFPMPSLRIRSENKKKIINQGDMIIRLWKQTAPGYRTVNMLFFRENESYVLILILRDSRNRTPEKLQKYKSEGIGVVEAAGSWIFPPPSDYPEAELIQNSRDIIKGFFEGIRAFDPSDREGYNFLYEKRINNE